MQVTQRSVLAADGWRLQAVDISPDSRPKALVVAGHAMMVDGRTLWRPDRPSIVGTLVDAGFRVLVADLRGHGASGPRADAGGDWTYDELVADTEVWRSLADDLADGLPVLWLSHSLFGHTSLAWFGLNPHRLPHAFVALAVNAWNRRFEPNPLLWLGKSTVMKTSRFAAERAGRMPVKRLRMGNHDEAIGYWRDLTRMAATRWESRTGTDYYVGMPNVSVPVLCVFSDGDRVFTRPADGLAFTAALSNRHVLRLGASCDVESLRGMTPGHMGLVTDASAAPLWQHVAKWFSARVQ